MRTPAFLLPLTAALLAATPLAATPAFAADLTDNAIAAHGEREAEQSIAKMTRAITRAPRDNTPVAKFYDEVCIEVVGLQSEYAAAIANGMANIARGLALPIGAEGCTPNIFVGIVEDAAGEVRTLRETTPRMFDSMLDSEVNRMLRSKAPVQAWHTTRAAGRDGRPLNNEVNRITFNRENEVTRTGGQVRIDMRGAVVLIDRDAIRGKSLQQVADYAAMRAFVSVENTSGEDRPEEIPTILSLFDGKGDAPEALTTFDRAYLESIYRLAPTATDANLPAETWAAYQIQVATQM